MSALKKLKHLDYAVYGNVIVPLLMFDTDIWFKIDDDSDAGKCRLVCRPRKRK